MLLHPIVIFFLYLGLQVLGFGSPTRRPVSPRPTRVVYVVTAPAYAGTAYQPGEACSPGDWNATISCPGDRALTVCDRVVQYCDPFAQPSGTSIATRCTSYTDRACAARGSLNALPTTPSPHNVGATLTPGGCREGATRLCTMPTTLLLGTSACAGGVYQACVTN